MGLIEGEYRTANAQSHPDAELRFKPESYLGFASVVQSIPCVKRNWNVEARS